MVVARALPLLSFWALGCTQNFGVFELGGADAGGDATQEPAADAGPCNGGTVYMGHCYFAVSPPAAWAAVSASCVSASAHLVTIGSAGEQMAVQGVGAGDRWIGLSRMAAQPAVDMSYVWVNGDPRNGYSNWSAGEPNGSGTTVRMRGNGTWSDTTDTSPYVGLCERP